MNIEKTIVVNFPEQDKETLRRMYRMVRDFDCLDISTSCISCPFYSFCGIIDYIDSDDESIREANFIKLVREKIISMCNED